MYEKLYAFSPMYKKLAKIEEDYETMLPQDERVSDALELNDMGLANQAYYLRMYGGYPVYHNTDVTFFSEPQKLLSDLEEHIQSAQKFIFLECHICEDSLIWKGLMEILRERADRGVEIRILYDGTGSKMRQHEKFAGWMKKKGIRCKVFHSRKNIATLNYRDYRKTLIIDGRYAYTGDYEFTNDQFIPESGKQGWKIAAVRMTGDAVRTFSLNFLKMWNATEETAEDPIPYLLKTAYRAADAGFAVPFATDPMKPEMLGKNAYLNLIRNARKYLYLVLPEEIKEEELQKELICAAKRGVHVYVLHSEKKNQKEKKPHWEITGKIRIFHFTQGRLKTRMIIADDQVAIVGNVHANNRDIYHMFENGCWFSLCRTVLELKSEFEKLLPFCRERV